MWQLSSLRLPYLTSRLFHFFQEEDYTDFFRPVLLTNDTGGVVVSQDLTSLVRREQPVSVVKFRVFCKSESPFTVSSRCDVTGLMRCLLFAHFLPARQYFQYRRYALEVQSPVCHILMLCVLQKESCFVVTANIVILKKKTLAS